MRALDLALHLLTPTVLGGTAPNERAELRAPSLKGALRFWFRALHPRFVEEEPTLFGSTTAGQAPLAIFVDPLVGEMTWSNRDYRDSRPGLAYLGYSLDLGENDRRALPPTDGLSLRLLSRRRDLRPEARQGWLAALWMLQTFGGLGTRANRGFGSVELEWRGAAEWPEARELRLEPAATPREWMESVRHNLSVFRGWFGGWGGGPTHPRWGTRSRAAVALQGFRTWEEALDVAGRALVTDARFEGGNGRRRLDPDYTNVKAHLLAEGARPVSGLAPAPARLKRAPQRAAFGLPLMFRYRSLQGPRTSIEFKPANGDRWPSPLRISVARIGGRLHPVYCLLEAPLPDRVRVGRSGEVPGPDGRLLQEFMDYVSDPARGVALR